MAKMLKTLRKGVTVEVISGKEKKKSGKVLNVLWDKQRVIVEKLNMQKRHTRPSGQNKQGGIVEQAGPIHFSNIKIVDTVVEEKKPAKKKAAKSDKKKK